jgi:2-amino-4-hydroxy-6-hydroxymethyldihydropteridine diphosphokinase
MSEIHRIYLSIGSNIEPEIHLTRAISLLGKYGWVKAFSTAWESSPVGSPGLNFLNACVLEEFSLSPSDLKVRVIDPIESALGRLRGPDKNAPRTVDIDIILVDGSPKNLELWNYPFVVVPLAELIPNMTHPLSHEKLIRAAQRMSAETRIIRRPDVLEAGTKRNK